MNIRSIILSLCLLALCATASHAQFADSVFANTVIAQYNVDFPNEALGMHDNKDATLNPQGLFDIGFNFGGGLLTMNKGAKLHLYWNKNGSDSAAAFLAFQRLTPEGALIYSRDTVIVAEPNGQAGMLSITVPDTGFNALDFSLTDSIKDGIPITGFGAKYFFLDGITLIQPVNAVRDVTTESAGLRAYPNPMLGGNSASFDFTMEHAGLAEIVATDMLGRVAAKLSLGQQPAGERTAAIPVLHSGIYLVRLLVDGIESARPVKLTVE